MAMSESVLSLGLQSMVAEVTEAAAIANFVQLYGDYVADARALTTIRADGIQLGRDAMPDAMVGMSDFAQAASKITAGIVAFWVAVAGGLTVSFAGATAITPPPHAGLLAALQPVYDANTAAKKSLVDASDAIAAVMHAQAIIGGTVTTVGPIVTPIL